MEAALHSALKAGESSLFSLGFLSVCLKDTVSHLSLET